MDTQVTDQTRIAAAFAQIAEVIRAETHNDATIFRMIAEMTMAAPGFTAAFSFNVANVLDEATGEIDYTEVVVEAYRRTLFSKEHAEKYGYTHCSDVASAEQFAARVSGASHNIAHATVSSLH